MKRHEVHLLRKAKYTQADITEFTGVSERSIRRIQGEPEVATFDDAQARASRGIGRPAKTEGFRAFVRETLQAEPTLLTVELLRRARDRGYAGAKTAFYEMVATERPSPAPRPLVRFEGLAGEFSQHDFGQTDVRFLNGTTRRVRFFASRLKWSRWAEVSIVSDETAETIVRCVVDHFERWGGVPLVSVFDRPTTVALEWQKDGTVTRWNPTLLEVAGQLGVGLEVCWPYRPQEKGAVENLVGWVKGSFFRQRRFYDMEDLHRQLSEWLTEVNVNRPNRATSIEPVQRLEEEKRRLRPLRLDPRTFELRYPIQVGPTGMVAHDGCRYSMPPDAISLSGTLFLGRDSVRIVAGRHEAIHPRLHEKGQQSVRPEHRNALVAAVHGKRGKLYLQRQQLLELDPIVIDYLTEVVHRRPATWRGDVERIHELLGTHGDALTVEAIRDAHKRGLYGGEYVTFLLLDRLRPEKSLTSAQTREAPT